MKNNNYIAVNDEIVHELYITVTDEIVHKYVTVRTKLFNILSQIDNNKAIKESNCQSEEEFEDTKGVIRILKSKMDRQHNGKEKEQKDK